MPRAVVGAKAAAPKTMRTFEVICEDVRAQIASGALKAGDKLPAERVMAVNYKVGRNAVREALRSLEMAGILRFGKGRAGGAFIRAGNAARLTHAMQDLFDLGTIELPELMEARLLVVAEVTRLAVERRSDTQVDHIEHIIDRIEELSQGDERERLVDTANEFYVELARMSGNQLYLMFMVALNQVLRRFVLESGVRSPMPDTTITARRRFLQYMRQGEVEAAQREMVQHLAYMHKGIAAAMRKAAAKAAEAGGSPRSKSTNAP